MNKFLKRIKLRETIFWLIGSMLLVGLIFFIYQSIRFIIENVNAALISSPVDVPTATRFYLKKLEKLGIIKNAPEATSTAPAEPAKE